MKYIKISLIFIMALLMINFIAGAALSNDGGGNWQYFREITVNNPSATLTDYQILVHLSGSSFPTTTSNGADVRFTDTNDNELSYWIENWDYAGKSGSIWVKVPSVTASGNTIIKMYYGNSKAGGVSNGENTFDFFDDFLGMTLDNNKWTTGGYGQDGGVLYDISDSTLNLWSDNSWRILRINKIFSPSQKVVVETKFLKTATSYWHQNFLVENDAINKNRFGLVEYVGIQQTIEGIAAFPKDFGIFDSNVWYISRIIKKNDTTFYIDALNSDRRSINYYETSQPVWSTVTWTWVSWQYNTTHVKFDWIYTHKYASPEPTIKLGDELPVPTPTISPIAAVTTTAVTAPIVTTTAPSNPGFQSNATTTQTSTAPILTTPKSASFTGKILDAITDDPVQGATVNIDGKSAASDLNGEYDLTLEVGKHTLIASKNGYESVTRSIIVSETGTMLDISLKPTSSDSLWFWIVLILLIVLVAAGIIYLMYRKKKSMESEEKERREKEEKEKQERERREKEEKEKQEREKREKEERERKVKEKKSLCMFCHAPLIAGSKYCNDCGKKQEEKIRFCMNCGSSMPHAPDLCSKCNRMPPSDVDTKTCKNCSEVIPEVAKFCGNCGARQPE